MRAAKQEALNIINQLPEDTNTDEIMYRLYVLDKINKGQEAIEHGRLPAAKPSSRKLIQGDLLRSS